MLFLNVSPISCRTSVSVADAEMGGKNPDEMMEDFTGVCESTWTHIHKHFLESPFETFV